MRKNELIRQLNLIKGNHIVHVPCTDDAYTTKEAKEVGVTSIPSETDIEPTIIIDFK